MWRSVLDTLPRGYALAERDWQRRHRLLLWVLGMHVPGLALFGAALGHTPQTVLYVLVTPAVCVALGSALRRLRRTAAVIVTAGLVYSSAALVGLTGGAIEAHFHFFIIIGFIALYQDWAPFLFNITFTVISHGIGSAWQQTLIFNHSAGQANPWVWSAIHGVAVLFACVGAMLFWRVTEDSQREKDMLSRRLAGAELRRRQFASDLLVNLARRNQSMLYRQLDIINQLEESEHDPEALAELFELDHLATRVRRNAESLLVLSGEQPPRTWSSPVPLRDALRAAVAEIEHLERVVLVVDEQPAVSGHAVTDLTHLIAELTENAVRFSPPDTVVTIRSCPDRHARGGHLVTVEDWGAGMRRDELDAANMLLADAPDVDLSVAEHLGFHVVARLAARHRIRVSLSAAPGSGVTAMVTLPAGLFEVALFEPGAPATRSPGPAPSRTPASRSAPPTAPVGGRTQRDDPFLTAPLPRIPASRVPTARTFGPTALPESRIPAPRLSGSSAPEQPFAHGATGHRSTPAQTWPAWRALEAGTAAEVAPAPPATAAVPAPGPAPSVARPASPAGRATPPAEQPRPAVHATLRRRVPQASLAPGLRDPGPGSARHERPEERFGADLSRASARLQAALAAPESGNR